MRVLLPAYGFWVATALLLFLRVDSFPVGDSSGEDELGDDPAGDSLYNSCRGLVLRLRATAAKQKDELCKEQNVCKGSMEMLIENNLSLPKITPEDGCSYMGFQKEACLRGLSSGLYAYQPYLEYVDDTFRDSAQGTGSLWPATQQLADNLKSVMIYPDTVTMLPPITQEMISAKLCKQKGWNITVIKYLILQDFTSFMEKTARALRRL